MQTTKLYRYVDGHTTIITYKRPNQSGYKTLSRLTADEGKILVNGNCRVKTIDTFKPKEWIEEDE